MNVKESAKLYSKWIRISIHLKQKLGNHFGFYNILSGLTENHLIQWGDLWIGLKEVGNSNILLISLQLTIYSILKPLTPVIIYLL